MRTVLIIGYLWPYHPKGGGRIPKLAPFLADLGWQPVILTAPLHQKPDLRCEIIESHYRDILSPYRRLYQSLFTPHPNSGIRNQMSRKLGVTSGTSSKRALLDFLFTRFDEIVGYPDFEKGWKSFATEIGSRLLRSRDVALIMSVSPPVTSHLIARELKLRHKIPWLADFCHLWSQNNGYPYSSLRRLIDRRLELKTLSEADALVTVSEPLARNLEVLHRRKPVYSIAHGFDPSTINIPSARLSAKFTITYTGSLHPRLREPSKLFTALRNLIERGAVERDDIEVRFYGPKEDWIDSEIEAYGLAGLVHQYGPVPLNVSLEKQRESQVLYFSMWGNSQESGIISSKIFEYLAAMRPILAVGEYNDVVNELLEDTRAGIWVSSVEDAERALRGMYQEYKATKRVASISHVSAINKYDRREMARRFSEIFESMV